MCGSHCRRFRPSPHPLPLLLILPLFAVFLPFASVWKRKGNGCYAGYSLICSLDFLRMVCRERVSLFDGKSCLHKLICKPVYGKKKKVKMLLASLGSVRVGQNCDLGLENAALSLRPQAAFSRPRSQFFPIRTSQPANNIYLSPLSLQRKWKLKKLLN